jgi:hypothetical protein
MDILYKMTLQIDIVRQGKKIEDQQELHKRYQL